MAVIPVPEQIVCVDGAAKALGVGFTITVAVMSAPVQPAADGVIVNVTVTGDDVGLVNTPLISPLPLAAIPVIVPVLFLVHVYVVDGTVLLNTMLAIPAPEQIVCVDGVANASGLGSTVTVAVADGPAHPFAVGVIVNVTVTGNNVVLISAPLISPLPLAAIPVTVPVLFLLHVKVVDGTEPLNTMFVIPVPEQIVCVDGVAVASGTG